MPRISAIGFPVALGGTIGYIAAGLHVHGLPGPHLGYVYLPAVLGTAMATVLTAPLGARTSHRIQVGLLRKLFALLMLALAGKLLLSIF